MGGRIPQTFLDELLARVDIVETINSRVPLKKAGREFTACCPFHSEKTPSFTVSPTKQFYHCFGCGAHGTALGFLMEYEHLEFVEAVEELARASGMEVPRSDTPARDERSRDLYQVMDMAAEYFRVQLRTHPTRQSAERYLGQRGLSNEIIARFGIGLAPAGWNNLLRFMHSKGVAEDTLLRAGLITRNEQQHCYDRFRERIIFPIRDRRGRTIGFGGRVLGEGTPKYLNSPETPVFHKGRELYGLFEARQQERNLQRLLVVEGYMDVVALAQFGINNVVATLGTATTREHLEILFRTVPGVVFSFDGDRAGREAAARALETALPVMRDGREVRFLFLPDGEDPDSLVRREGAEAFRSRLQSAKLLSDFLLERLQDGLETGKPDGQAGLLARAARLLKQVPGGAFWELLVGELARITRLSEARVLAHLSPARSGASTHPVPHRDPAGLTRTPVRHAIALLLHQPQLAQAVTDSHALSEIPERGIDLLVEMLEISRKYPNLNGAGLLERYRGSQHEAALLRLSEWQPEISEQHLDEELRSTIARLCERHAPERQLLDKLARGQKLDDDELENLRGMTERSKQEDSDRS